MYQRNIEVAGGGIKRRKIGCHNIFEKIISLENLFLAWQEFCRGKKSKFDVQQFECNLENNIFGLHQALQNKTYQHSHYTSFYIKDPKLRHIHKACVRDRVLHHAVFRVIYCVFDKSFIFDSYSCRLGKGTHRAVNRLQKFARKVSKNNTKNCFVLKCDIKKFFASIDQETLTILLKKKVKDENALWLFGQVIRSFSSLSDKGLPLGNITSQLFANIYLDELDRFIKHNLRIKYYIRYCDDFVILSENRVFLESLISKIGDFLKARLQLSLYEDKIVVRKYRHGVDFLGYVSFSHHRILRVATRNRMFRKLEQKIEAFKQGKISDKILKQITYSYLGALKHCNSYVMQRKLISNVTRYIKMPKGCHTYKRRYNNQKWQNYIKI